MRHLLLLRHAKAVPQTPTHDELRDLDARGRSEAAAMGRWAALHGLAPDLALISPARRTRETARLFFEAARRPPPPQQFEERLYSAGAGVLLAAINKTDASVSRLILVGHNPSIGELACALAGSGDAEARAAMSDFAPAGLAAIDFAFDDWRGVAPGAGSLASFTTPAMIGA